MGRNIGNKYRSKKNPRYNKASQAQRFRRKTKANEVEDLDSSVRAIDEESLSITEQVNETPCSSISIVDINDEQEVVDTREETISEADPYLIETSNNVLTSKIPSGLVISDLAHVISQAREIEQHSSLCDFGGTFQFEKSIRNGLHVTLHYKCTNVLCGKIKTLTSDKEKDTLNQLAVLGALSTGSGFSQEEEKFSIMNIPYMSQKKFTRCERIGEHFTNACLGDQVNTYIQLEKDKAKERGDIDSDGYACLTVIVDGGWCKRSYGHGYNASSGVAVIIGAETQKIIFIGVRNKVCLICTAILQGRIPRKNHICWKNWNKSSTAMESDIIVEGLQYLENVHNIRCTRLLGDGDSNTMCKVREMIGYGSRVVKIECANHAVRRYSRHLQILQKNTHRFKGPVGVKARKLLKERVPRLVRGARQAIKNHAVKNEEEIQSSTIQNLIAELRNGPSHVFGNHTDCGSFCTRKISDPDENVYDLIFSSGLLQAIQEVIDRILISCSNSLIWNATNNPAEHYMGQLCKTSGGKRVDFSKAGGVTRRAKIAAMAFQSPAQQWHRRVIKSITKTSTPTLKFLKSRKRKYLRGLNRRLFHHSNGLKKTEKVQIPSGGDESYGDFAQKPDIDPQVYDTLMTCHMKRISVSSKDALEILTRNQANSEKWRQERALRISSSFFKDVASRRPYTKSAKLVKRIVYSESIQSEAIKYGIINEDKARQQYETENSCTVIKCGLFVDVDNPFLCTSPDGLIGHDGLLEIKCPYSARFCTTFKDFLSKSSQIGVKLSPAGFPYLPHNHKYFYQIQGQLAITERAWCDLYVWSKNDTIKIRVNRDQPFWQRIVPKLKKFYFDCVVPEILDGRVPRKMPLREPHYILDAIKNRNNKVKEISLNSTGTESHPEKPIKASTDSSPSISSRLFVQDKEATLETHNKTEDANKRVKRIKKPRVLFDL